MRTPELTYALNSRLIREYYKDHIFGNRKASEELRIESQRIWPLWDKFAANGVTEEETIEFSKVSREYCRAKSEVWYVKVGIQRGRANQDDLAESMEKAEKRFKELEQFANTKSL